MPEIDITDFFARDDHEEFSGSVMERGKNAARETWENAQAEAKEKPLLPAEYVNHARDYFTAMGFSEDEDTNAMSDDDINSLMVQEVSHNIRELKDLCTAPDGKIKWKHYESLAEKGTVSGSIFKSGKKIYFSF